MRLPRCAPGSKLLAYLRRSRPLMPVVLEQVDDALNRDDLVRRASAILSQTLLELSLSKTIWMRVKLFLDHLQLLV